MEQIIQIPKFRFNLSTTRKIKKVVRKKIQSETDFKKKVKPVQKQIDELTTLCSIPACLFIQSPLKGNGQCPRSYMWPESMDEVRDVIGLYQSTRGKSTKGSEVSKRVLLNDEESKKLTDEWKKRVLLIDEGSKKLTTNEWKKLLECADEKIIDLKRKIETIKVGRVSSDFRLHDETLNKLSNNEVNNLLRELDLKIECSEKEIQRRKKIRKASLVEPRSRPLLDLNDEWLSESSVENAKKFGSTLENTSSTLSGSNESVTS